MESIITHTEDPQNSDNVISAETLKLGQKGSEIEGHERRLFTSKIQQVGNRLIKLLN